MVAVVVVAVVVGVAVAVAVGVGLEAETQPSKRRSRERRHEDYMPSKNPKTQAAMPAELMRSAPVPKLLEAPPTFLDARAATRFAVETAASNALDQLPEGYRAFEVRVVARRVNKAQERGNQS